MDVSHFTWIPRAVMNVCFLAGMSMPETSRYKAFLRKLKLPE